MVVQPAWEVERAEALAKVILTRTPVLDVLDVPPSQHVGDYDLLARARTGEFAGLPLFAVEVKGLREGPSDGKAPVRLNGASGRWSSLDLPLLLIVVDLREEVGQFVWLVEPWVDKDGRPALRVRNEYASSSRGASSLAVPRQALQPLDKGAVVRLTDEVLRWHTVRRPAHEPAVALTVSPNGADDGAEP